MNKAADSKKGIYLVFVECDIDPTIYGPFKDEEERDQKAHELRWDEGSEHGFFPMSVDASGNPEIGSYSGRFFEEDDAGFFEEDGTELCPMNG